MDTIFRCAIIVLFFAAFGLLGLLHGENIRLTQARRRTAQVLRRVRREKTAALESLEAAGEFARDEMIRADELEAELRAYRSEREERAWLN